MILEHDIGSHITYETDDDSALLSDLNTRKDGQYARRRLEALIEEARLLKELSEDEYYK